MQHVLSHSLIPALAGVLKAHSLGSLIALVATAAMLSLSMGLPVFGAALTVEAPVLTWQRVRTALDAATASPGAQMLFRQFKSFLMQQRGQIHLQFIPISDLGDDVNDLDGALRVYAIYLRKQGTATDAYYKLHDDAANTGTASHQRVVLPVFEANKESILFFPDGIPFASGLVHTSQTTADGTTDSTAGDGPNGFLLVG